MDGTEALSFAGATDRDTPGAGEAAFRGDDRCRGAAIVMRTAFGLVKAVSLLSIRGMGPAQLMFEHPLRDDSSVPLFQRPVFGSCTVKRKSPAEGGDRQGSLYTEQPRGGTGEARGCHSFNRRGWSPFHQLLL